MFSPVLVALMPAVPTRIWQRFFARESASTVGLVLAILLALVWSNSPWRAFYEASFNQPLWLQKSAAFWINDGFMSVFFLAVGLELKRELLVGELAQKARARTPLVAALGGMVMPAVFYVLINLHDPSALRGWAIPSATDIAFAAGVMTLLGPKVPSSLKVFLMALAIIDDLGAILVIAFFYTTSLSWAWLGGAALVCGLGLLLHRRRVMVFWPYALMGLGLWGCVWQAGVHPTVAGVVCAMFIPLRGHHQGPGLLTRVETMLHPWVAYLILPFFALANAGVTLSDLHVSEVWRPVPMGIVCGLIFGKSLGIFGATWLLVKAGWGAFPAGASRRQFLGMCQLCGMGFTMSLLIGHLAFSGPQMSQVKLGILIGSTLAGLWGSWTLMRASS